MPEFILEGRDHAARAESAFVLGFIEAAFFTSCSPGVEACDWFKPEVQAQHEAGTLDGCLPCDVGYTEIHPDSVAAIRRYCEAFQAKAADLLAFACGPMSGYDETQAGRDLWFTVNGHGVGYWDREELRRDMARRPDGTLTDTGEEEGLPFLESLGALLTEAAGRDEINPFFGDHVTHGDSPFVHFDL